MTKGRTSPFTSPRRAHGAFRRARTAILRELGLASHLSGCHFGIVWVDPAGKTEVYASEALQPLLARFFPADALEEAKIAAARVAARKAQDRNARSEPADVYGASGEAYQPNLAEQQQDALDDLDSEDDEMMGRQRGGGGSNTTTRRHVTAPTIPPSAASHPTSIPSAPVVQLPTPSRLPHQISAPDDSPTSPPSAPARVTRSLTHLSAETRSSPSLSPSAYVPHTFSPTTLAAWYHEKFTALPQKVCKTVLKVWIRVVEPEKQTKWPYIAGDAGAPAWWPAGVRHREPDHLIKAERLTLLDTLIHVNAIPVSHFERATAKSSALIPAKQAPLLDEIYKCAREERRARQANGGSFEWLTVLLPESSNPDETFSPKTEAGSTRHRSRRSISTLPSDGDATPRLRSAAEPYPLSRSHSVSDVHSTGSPVPSRPLSRSHSLSGHLSNAGGRDRSLTTVGRASRKGRVSLGGVSEQGEYGTTADAGSSMAQFGLQPAISLQHGASGQPLSVNDPRRPSKQEQPTYQLYDRPSPSSGRMQSSPPGQGRSQASASSIEPSFASPAMIKSRSHLSHQQLGSIAEGGSSANEFGQRSSVAGSSSSRPRPSVLMPVHPAHGIDTHALESSMSSDYSTSSYSHPHPSVLSHSQPSTHSYYGEPPAPLQPMQPHRPSPVLFQASTFGASLADAPHSAPSYYDHHPLHEHHHDPYGPAYAHQISSSVHQAPHQLASQYYYTPESLDESGCDPQGMSYIHQPSEYDYDHAHSARAGGAYATDLGVTGLMGGDMTSMYEQEAERTRRERRYQDHAYGVQG